MNIVIRCFLLCWVLWACDRYNPSHEEIPDVPKRQQVYSAEAMRLVERMIEQYPNEPLYRYKKGIMLCGKGEWNEAVEVFGQALKYDSLNPRYRFALATAYHAQGEYSPALNTLQRVLPKLENDFESLVLAGELYYRNKEYDNATKHLNKALKLVPHEADVYYWKGVVALARLDTATAIRNLNQVLKRKPDYALAYNAFAEMYNRYDLTNLAIEYTNKGLAYNAQTPELYFTKAEAFRLKRYYEDSARANYERAYRLNRKLYWAGYHLGKYAYDAGKYEEASRYFEAVLKLEPTLAYANYYLGMCLRVRGEKDKALKKFALAMKQDTRLLIAVEMYWATNNEIQQERYWRYEDSLRKAGLMPVVVDTTKVN